jgi:hypothetical protein
MGKAGPTLPAREEGDNPPGHLCMVRLRMPQGGGEEGQGHHHSRGTAQHHRACRQSVRIAAQCNKDSQAIRVRSPQA